MTRLLLLAIVVTATGCATQRHLEYDINGVPYAVDRKIIFDPAFIERLNNPLGGGSLGGSQCFGNVTSSTTFTMNCW